MMPEWYRKQYYEHKLRHVLQNPLADIRDVKAAKLAVKEKLIEDKIKHHYRIQKKAEELKKLL